MSSTPADPGGVFVDTNILVYAHDAKAGAKRDRARLVVLDLRERGKGCLSIQVLQELFVVVTRKVPRPLSVDVATGLISGTIKQTHVCSQAMSLLILPNLSNRGEARWPRYRSVPNG